METQISKEDILGWIKAEKLLNGGSRQNERVLRSFAVILIGNTCQICGTTQNVAFHEIHGKNHNQNSYRLRIYYYLENAGDFVPICLKCHRFLHSLKFVTLTEWEIERITQICLRSGKDPQIVLRLLPALLRKK